MNVLMDLVLVLLVCLFVVLLFMVLIHLSRVEGMGTHVISLMVIYGPTSLRLIAVIIGGFFVLGIILGIVKILAAISETLSYASLASVRVKHEKAKIPHSRSLRSLPKSRRFRGTRRYTAVW